MANLRSILFVSGVNPLTHFALLCDALASGAFDGLMFESNPPNADGSVSPDWTNDGQLKAWRTLAARCKWYGVTPIAHVLYQLATPERRAAIRCLAASIGFGGVYFDGAELLVVPSAGVAGWPSIAAQGQAIATSMQEYLDSQPPQNYVATSTLYSEAVALSTHVGQMDWYSPAYPVAARVSDWIAFQVQRLNAFAAEAAVRDKVMDCGWVRQPAARWNDELPVGGWLSVGDVEEVCAAPSQFAATWQNSITELRDWPQRLACLTTIAAARDAYAPKAPPPAPPGGLAVQ